LIKMASNTSMMSAVVRRAGQNDDLRLRETNHRCSNDLQLVVGLLALQSRRAVTSETREALADVMERVAILARVRSAQHRGSTPSLEGAMRQVCEALQPQAEPRSILISLEVRDEARDLSATHTTTLALVVNELTTNAIKHAFPDGGSGIIRVWIGRNGGGDLVIIVQDDGRPFVEAAGSTKGLGMGLAKRLMASIGGFFIPPPSGSKAFELRMPVNTHR
jgi:two-component sensor histidine kinase